MRLYVRSDGGKQEQVGGKRTGEQLSSGTVEKKGKNSGGREKACKKREGEIICRGVSAMKDRLRLR